MNYYVMSPSSKLKNLKLEKFGGVDFFSNETQMSLSRSPDAKNMIADSQYFPVKRTGYKKVYGKYSGEIYGLFLYPHQDKRESIIHAGTELHSVDLSTFSDKLLYSGIARERSDAFVMKNVLYFLDGVKFLMYDGTNINPVEDKAYVPTTSIGRKPSGGGTVYESENLLTRYRKNSFTADGKSTEFILDTANLGAGTVECYISGAKKTEGRDFTVNRSKGSVTFTAAPADDLRVDSVLISFETSGEDKREQINKCRICSVFSGRGASTVFLSGNRSMPNADWHSGTFNPTYFPKSGHTLIGSDSSRIMGYIRQFDAQIILKSANGKDATQYLRTSEIDQNSGTVYFPVQQGADGIGAVAEKSIAILEDTPLFLSDRGVYASVGNDITLVRTMSHRSKAVDKKLLDERGLENACGCEYMGKYYLAVNSHCYVADSRQMYVDNVQSKSYEWYYWENIPATCWLECDGRLYFGSDDGCVYRFCNENEENAYSDNGQAIDAYWKTPMIKFGTGSFYKNIRRVTVLALPYMRSSLQIMYNTDKEWEKKVLNENIDMFSWDNLDFSRFSFRTIPAPVPLCANKKMRKVSVFQMVLKNDRNNEPFGFLSAEIDYMTGGRIKR